MTLRAVVMAALAAMGVALVVIGPAAVVPVRAQQRPLQAGAASELRVLRYLPTNLTRPDIAQELYVSVNTVNTHIRHIYSKLGARDRSSAVQRARELRLLSTGRNHQIPASPAH